MSLSERMRSGLKEMPSNAAWLLSRVREPGDPGSATDSAKAGARDRRRKWSAALVDAAPGGGDSVEIRMKRAMRQNEPARPRTRPWRPRRSPRSRRITRAR